MPAYLVLALLIVLSAPVSLAATPAAAGDDTQAPAATAIPNDVDTERNERKANANADAVDDLDADNDDGAADYDDANDGDQFDVDR